MQIELDDAEVAALHSLLTGALAELSSEIADTDNPQYLRGLRAERDRLRGIAERLGAAGSG